MTPERAVAIRCCGPFLLPFSTPIIPLAPPCFSPFQGGFLRRNITKMTLAPPENSPQRGGFLRKNGDKIPWHCSKNSPSDSTGIPSNQPQTHLQSNRNLLKKRLYFGSIPPDFTPKSPRSHPPGRGVDGENAREDDRECRLRSDPL